MTILRCINDNGDKFDLDLLEQVPFTLDISAIESGNIGQVFGVSSQKLTLPPSKTNNEFFGNLYDVGSTPATSFIKTVPCQVLNDGIEIFTGELYLESVITDNNGNDLYNVVVVNETVDFGFLIKDTTFADLDFSSLNHDYTYGNITSSWDQTLEDGAVYYPLINYGFDDDNPQDTQIKSGGEPRSFTNYDSPLQVDDFKPAIRLRDCLDAIFANTPYEYTSSFFSSGSYTDDIYLLASKDDKKGISDINPVSQSFLAYNNANQNIVAQTGPQKVNFQLELFDNSGNWDNSTSTFTAGEDGGYQFKVQFNYTVVGFTSANDARTLNIRIYKNGSEEEVGSFNLQGSTSGLLNYTSTVINLDAADTVEIYASYTEIASGPPTFRINTSGTQTRLELRQAPATEIGGAVDLSRVYSDISIPDFMSGLIEKFNLVIEPVRNERNVLKIEPFNDWIDAGRTVDWSNKVDYSVKWDIKHPLQNQPKDITFTDVEDNIALLQWHKRTKDRIYGEYKYISDSDLTQGEKTIGKLFAPTPFKEIDGAPYVVLPALCEKDDSTQQYKRTKFAPRLLFHNGRKEAFGLIGEDASNNRSYSKYYFKDENGTVHTETDYGLASHLQDVEADFDDTIDLHFGNTHSPGHYNYHQSEYNGRVKRTAFYEYWSFYINELYDVDSRLVTLNIFLNPTELPEIELNDKIHIDGHYYRINKIQGANVLNEASVAVELIKTLPRKLRFPRRRIFIDDEPVDITVDDNAFGQSGKVGYEDFNTGTTYTGSAVPGAAQRDGFQVYGSGASQETVWDTLKPTEARFTSQTSIGLNQVDKSAETIDARGNGNKVRNNTQIVRVEGSNNTIDNNAKFITVTGNDNTIEQNVENSAIQQSTTSSISEDTTLSTIIGGEDSHISGSNKTVLIGQDLTVEGGNSNIVIGNLDSTAKTVKDLNNTTVINLNKDIESIENAGGDHYSGLAQLGSYNQIGAIYRDYAVITGSAGGETYLTGSEYADAYYIHLTWQGGNGTHILHLPSYERQALTRDGNGYKRELRFFTDNSLVNNSTIFRLDPSGSQVIDGTTFTEDLKRPLDGVTIFGTDNSWYTLQRKSK
jgi:hypothetical protein